MKYYFKDKENGVGFADNQNFIGDVIWITKEEYEELIAIHEAEEAAAAQLEE